MRDAIGLRNTGAFGEVHPRGVCRETLSMSYIITTVWL